jgi:hypothetical protein
VIDLDMMPLDTPEHVRHAWHMLHQPVLLTTLRQVMQPAEARTAIALAKDRVQTAAVEHGMGFFEEP